MRSRRSDLGLIIAACTLTIGVAPGVGMSCARAQSQPVPGSPSLPLLAPAIANGVQDRITYQHGIEFVTIGAAGNAPWQGNGTPGDIVVGRGSVNYEYRIGRYEVTTSQWVAFMNAAFDRPADDRLPFLQPPGAGFWGGVATTPTVPGGARWTVPAGSEHRGVGDISWRMAAMYCNWLTNDQSTARSAFLNGAYDVSTFGYLPNTSIFTDQLTHSPGAKFWIPTWDEWIKAAHYDPGKNNGQGQTPGGYWLQPISQDGLIAYGPPGLPINPATGALDVGPSGVLAQANAGYTDQFGTNPFTVPLGAYALQAQSPWGLLDAAGGTNEWLEETVLFFGAPTGRNFLGSAWRSSLGNARAGDLLPGSGLGGDWPDLALYNNGFRIAAAVPTPQSGGLIFTAACWSFRRARRRTAGGPTRTTTLLLASRALDLRTALRTTLEDKSRGTGGGRSASPSWDRL